MYYGLRQRSLARHLTGIAVALVLHLLAIFMLMNSSLRIRAVTSSQLPIDVKILEEVKTPTRNDAPSPSPKLRKLPQAFVPPPEVQVQIPDEPRVAILIPTNVPPPAERAPAGRRMGRGVGTGIGVGQGAPNLGVACPNSLQIRAGITYPEQARRDKLEGSVLIEFTLMADGSIKDIDILSSSDRVFNNVSVSAVRQFVCTSQGSDVRVAVPFVFKLNNQLP